MEEGHELKEEFHVFSLCHCELSAWKDLFGERRLETLTGHVEPERDLARVTDGVAKGAPASH